MQPQAFGGVSRTIDLPAARFEGARDMRPLDVGESGAERRSDLATPVRGPVTGTAHGRLVERGRERVQCQGGAAGENQGPVDGVLELAHVAVGRADLILQVDVLRFETAGQLSRRLTRLEAGSEFLRAGFESQGCRWADAPGTSCYIRELLTLKVSFVAPNAPSWRPFVDGDLLAAAAFLTRIWRG